MSTGDENKAVVQRVWQEIINEGKVDLSDELVDPKYIYQGPGGYEAKGPKGFRRLVSANRNSMPDLNTTVNDYIVERDMVVSRWTLQGTNKEMKKQVNIFGITITRVNDGKMIEDWEIYDRLDIAEKAASGWLQKWIVGSISKQFKKYQP